MAYKSPIEQIRDALHTFARRAMQARAQLERRTIDTYWLKQNV